MKRIVLLMAAFIVTTAVRGQDDNGESCFPCNRITIEGCLMAMTKSNDLSPLPVQLNVGYSILPKLNIYFAAESVLGLSESKKGFGTYYSSNSIGGGLSYQLLYSEKGFLPPFRTLDVHFTWGTTIGNPLWKYNLYEAGLSLGFRNSNTPVFGVGYRLMSSKRDGIDDLKGIVFSLGFRF